MKINNNLSVFFLTIAKPKTEIKTFAVARYKNKLYKLPKISVCKLKQDPFVKSIGKLKCFMNNRALLRTLTGLTGRQLVDIFVHTYRIPTYPTRALTPGAWVKHVTKYNKQAYTEWTCLPELPDVDIDLETVEHEIFKLEQEQVLANERLADLRAQRDEFAK